MYSSRRMSILRVGDLDALEVNLEVVFVDHVAHDLLGPQQDGPSHVFVDEPPDSLQDPRVFALGKHDTLRVVARLANETTDHFRALAKQSPQMFPV